MRAIHVLAPYVGMVDAILTLDECARPFPLEDRDYCRMTLTAAGTVIAAAEPFGTGTGGSWEDRSDAEVMGTFGAFLGHALESGEADGWTLSDAASDWVDALTIGGDNA